MKYYVIAALEITWIEQAITSLIFLFFSPCLFAFCYRRTSIGKFTYCTSSNIKLLALKNNVTCAKENEDTIYSEHRGRNIIRLMYCTVPVLYKYVSVMKWTGTSPRVIHVLLQHQTADLLLSYWRRLIINRNRHMKCISGNNRYWYVVRDILHSTVIWIIMNEE